MESADGKRHPVCVGDLLRNPIITGLPPHDGAELPRLLASMPVPPTRSVSRRHWFSRWPAPLT
ncbi:plasmid partitioning/stability family protein [Klebsiella pneumoniae]|nr:plasmid partitioning/stability family protein [Klebsiella pneumoniae]